MTMTEVSFFFIRLNFILVVENLVLSVGGITLKRIFRVIKKKITRHRHQCQKNNQHHLMDHFAVAMKIVDPKLI